MAYEPGKNPFNPLIIGAVAVILALIAFLVLREPTGTQQAGIDSSPPASTAPAPSPTPPPATQKSPSIPPAGGSGSQ